ncbi:MAG: DNA gyrase subunit B [Deltaproteobacteria bacterium]|nr:DNA gyrase subunit B [Deltaproteobacteria bacterium]
MLRTPACAKTRRGRRQREAGLGGDGYGDEDIRVLEGLEAVRLRPGMYIGSTGPRGLHHLVYEIVDNAVDEALAGHCKLIEVRLLPDDGVQVRDDGRGIPTGLNAETGLPTAQVVFTKLHAGGKFGGSGYKVSGGLHGVGASVVNALSGSLELEIWRDGKAFSQRYERGVPVTPLTETGSTRRRGTQVRFWPDSQIFQTTRFSVETLGNRLRELAFLNPGLSIRLEDQRPAPEDAEGGEEGTAERFDTTFAYPGGVGDFVQYLNENRSAIHEPIVFRGSSADIEVEVALQYNDGYSESIASFVNCINTIEGGQHETGFKTAHTRVMNEYARKLGIWKKKDNLTGDDVREGMVAVINLRMTHVEFEGQTKSKLGNPEARAAVEEVTSKHLAAFLEENPKVAKLLLETAARASSARDAARKARAAVRTGKSSKTRTSLEGKLTRCASRVAEENEVFIVEGDSAGGSAKQARDRIHQAILPLKGKPLNTEKASLAKVLANKEILAIVQAIGAGIGSEFDLAEANYGRVIILADADDDGAHIRCLLLTFFYRFMKELIMAGRVFIAQPPLFKVERKVKKRVEVKYCWALDDMTATVERWGRGAVVQRFKGLGEMDAEQLWETTMNPATRTLVRVDLEDAATAERQVTVLMGSRPELRKTWIAANVRFGEDGDGPAGAELEDAEEQDDAGFNGAEDAGIEEAAL